MDHSWIADKPGDVLNDIVVNGLIRVIE